jgi:ABC-2 type transport system permease protein
VIRAFRAELAKLMRRRVILVAALVALVVGSAGPAVVLAAAEPEAEVGAAAGRVPTLEELAEAGGGTAIFRDVAAFAGTLVFVVVIGLIAVEFSRGTMRTMLLRQPQRIRLLAGKLAAMLTFAAATLALTEVVTWIAARLQAPGADVATGAWTSVDALGAAVGDYGAVLLWITGYVVLGTMVAVLLRSVPLALAVGVAWAGPFEHLVQDAWGPAERVFPGLLLEAFAAGGTPDVTSSRALATVAGYVAVAAVVASAVFSRRDVTA